MFYEDKVVGDFGEKLAFELLEKSNKTVELHNVSDDQAFQDRDIDLVQMLDDNHTLDDVRDEICKPRQPKISYANTYEVKTDKRTHDTRNFVYEIISHDGAGWAGKCKADFIIYYCTDRYDWHDVKEVYLIKLKEWRKWLRENINDKEKIIFKNYDKNNEAILNALCNVEKMKEEGIAVLINQE